MPTINYGDYGDSVYTNNKKLPVVLCLDVSGSMSYPSGQDAKYRYERQNDAVETLFSSIVSVPKALDSAEIAVIAFADKVWYETDFAPIHRMKFPPCQDERLKVSSRRASGICEVDNVQRMVSFNTPLLEYVPAGIPTRLCPAITRAVEKLDQWVEQHKGTSHYAPFIILSTDCDRNGLVDTEEDKKYTQKLLHDHMNVSNLEDTLIPLFVNVNKHGDMEDLRRYAGAFPEGCIRQEDVSQLNNLFRTLAACIANTINYSPTRNAAGCGNHSNPILQLVHDTLDDLDEEF